MICVLKDNIVCAIYVNDPILWSPDNSKIGQVISGLKELNFELTDGEGIDTFLGINIDRVDNDTVMREYRTSVHTILIIGISLYEWFRTYTPSQIVTVRSPEWTTRQYYSIISGYEPNKFNRNLPLLCPLVLLHSNVSLTV